MLKNWLISGLHAVRTRYQRAGLYLMAALMVFSFSFSFVGAPTASAATSSNPGSNFSESVATCAIQSVGWVICPVMRTIAQLADYGFAFINVNFLRIEYALTGGDSGIFKAWELIRNIANVVLVLVFLYIVYTQITGRNTGDFNLKRILPRLMIGAVLLNLSYYVCAGSIQLSNIIGSSIISIMIDAAQQIGTPAMSLNTSGGDGFQDGTLTNLVTTMLSKSGTVWVMLAPMATVTISIAVVSAAGLVLLIARKVVVSMLVLVSPLLFVAYLLPNLERYFQQWVRLFVQLLLLYPIVAFLLGTGQIVSATIISVGTGGESDYHVQGDGYQARTGGSGSATTDLAAAGAAVLPLIGVWWMMKGLSAVMSTAGTRITAGIGRGTRSRQQAEKLQAKFGKPNLQTNAGNINVMGGRVNVYDRKPNFSRVPGRRHRATPGSSSLPLGKAGENQPRPGAATPPLPSPNFPLPGEIKAQSDAAAEATKKMDEFNNANISADKATAAGVQAMASAASDDKKKSANDLFKNLNQRNKPQSPDAQRSFGTAQAPAGSGGGGGSAQAPSVSSRSNEYRAPAMAQTPSAPQQSATQRIVVTPQVDASALLNNQQAAEMPRATAHHEAPTSGMQQKAKGIAQKYLFDSARDVDDAAKKLDELTATRDEDDKPGTPKDK